MGPELVTLLAVVGGVLLAGGLFWGGYSVRGRVAGAQIELKEQVISDQRDRMDYLRRSLALELAEARARQAGASVDYGKLEQRLSSLREPDPLVMHVNRLRNSRGIRPSSLQDS